jgi:Uma2 family endonuclease
VSDECGVGEAEGNAGGIVALAEGSPLRTGGRRTGGETYVLDFRSTDGATGAVFWSVYCEQHEAGSVSGSDARFRCFPDDPDKVRLPDLVFIRKERLTPELGTAGFISVPPDLVVEVLSPSDVSYEVDRRVQDYLSAGVKLVWVVHPQSRSVHVYRPGGQGVILSERDELDGEEVLPGFRLPVREIFRPLEQLPQKTGEKT